MKTQFFLLITILSSINGYSQNPTDKIFTSKPPDFSFQVLYARDGHAASYSKNEYTKVDKIVQGKFISEANGKYILNIDRDFNFAINSLVVSEPQIASDGQKVNMMQSEDCRNETTGGKIGFLLYKYENQDLYHITLLDKEYNYVHEYVIKIDQSSRSYYDIKNPNQEKPVSVHVFRDISQMSFNEETSMWGESEKTDNSVEIKKFILPDSDQEVYQMNKYVKGKTKPDISINFKYQKRDKVGNFIYSCLSGQIGTEKFDLESIASISLQSSENLSDMAIGKAGYLTTTILNWGILCLICEN